MDLGRWKGMTNEEAIKTLEANYPDACFEQLREAVDAAIEALKAQDADSDTISRKATIDAILAVTGNSSVRELYEHVQEHGLSDMWSGGVNAAIDIIIAVPSVQPEQQWIPCSERLPDKEGTYLVTDDAGGVIYIHDDGFFYCDDEKPTWLLSQNAKAWMPLPEPYREDEG